VHDHRSDSYTVKLRIEAGSPYGITQYYLPPDTSERAPFNTPASNLVLDLPTPKGWKAGLIYRLPGSAPARSLTRDLSVTSPTS